MNIRHATKKNSNNIFGIHGGGNIGLGLMADVASKSPFDYQIVATSNDKFLKKIVNGTHQLWLQHNNSITRKTTHIKNVTIVSREFDDIVKLYKRSAILAICLTPSAISQSAKAVAQGLIERYRAGLPHLKILVLMNLPDCAEVVKKIISTEILLSVSDKVEAQQICESVKFIPTVVDRIVTKIPEQDLKKQLKKHLLSCISMDFINPIWLNSQVNELLENGDKLAEAINQFSLQFKLFNAENSFALYAPDKVPEILQFPDIKTVGNLDQVEAIKNKYINGPHAMIAWLGGLLGADTIADALNLPGLKSFVEKMMDQEIAPVLLAAYPDLTHDELIFFKKLFFERCEASIDDPVQRVARDPLRKINSGERLLGTIELAKGQKKNLALSGLEFGIAAAILYAVKQIDPSNVESKTVREIYQKNKSYRDVLTYQGPYSSGMFRGLDAKQDAVQIQRILNQITALEKIYALHKTGKQPTLHVYQEESSTKIVMKNFSKNPQIAPRIAVSIPSEVPSQTNMPLNFIKSLSFLNKPQVAPNKPTKNQSTVYNYGNRI